MKLTLVRKLSKIDFGNPYLQKVKLVRKYELKGVAFVEGYEKTVGFTFHSGYPGNLSLEMDDLYQAKDVYRLFRNLFRDFSKESGMQKCFSTLAVEWNIVEAKKEEILLGIEKAMGSDWKDSFKIILSVYKE